MLAIPPPIKLPGIDEVCVLLTVGSQKGHRKEKDRAYPIWNFSRRPPYPNGLVRIPIFLIVVLDKHSKSILIWLAFIFFGPGAHICEEELFGAPS